MTRPFFGFKQVFKNLVEGENPVCCPFHNDKTPSASVKLDVEGNMFYCQTCGIGYNEQQFVAKYLRISFKDAYKLVGERASSQTLESWKQAEENLLTSGRADLEYLKIDTSVAKKFKLGYQGAGVIIPVIMEGEIVDERTYNPDATPKVKSRMGALNGMPVGYHLLNNSNKNKWVLICEGEKDMLAAANKGFNAISITGGARAIPKMFPTYFKDRKWAIVYDNDDAGRQGASALAEWLLDKASEVKVVDLSSVCSNKGEDIFDFFNKYNKTKDDLVELIRQAPSFTETEISNESVSLLDAANSINLGKYVISNVQISGNSENSFTVPEVAEVQLGDSRTTWMLDESTLEDIPKLCDGTIKESAIYKYLQTKTYGAEGKTAIVNIKSYTTVYKAAITDSMDNKAPIPQTYMAYIVGQKLEAGKNYKIKFKISHNPMDAMKNIALISEAKLSSDFISMFTVTEDIKKSLTVFQKQEDVKFDEYMRTLIQSIKGITKNDNDEHLLLAADLWFHSPLRFNFGPHKNLRAYTEALWVTPPRFGKSSSIGALIAEYGVGQIASLAGTSATEQSLIGGTAPNGMITAGLIPRNNERALIFEELSKSDPKLLQHFTDIRSSQKVRINRVAGSAEFPANVRMLYLSNTRAGKDGTVSPIENYPNGFQIITDLVGTPEDIARYDFILILQNKKGKVIDPLWRAPFKFDTKNLRDRLKWVWSRPADKIIIDEDVEKHIAQESKKLVAQFKTSIPLFSDTETWMKITRLSIALAGYTVSTDANFENIIVTKEHVDYIVEWVTSIYDNDIFKLRSYVDEERKFIKVDQESIEDVSKYNHVNPLIISHLYNSASTNANTLFTISMLDKKEFNVVIGELVKSNLIRVNKESIIPTARFRESYEMMNKNKSLKRASTSLDDRME